MQICRSASLAHVNSMLREQLDQATAANQSLTADIHKLTQEWQRAREELDAKESEWREEEQVTWIEFEFRMCQNRNANILCHDGDLIVKFETI